MCGKDGVPGHYCGHDGHSSIPAGLEISMHGTPSHAAYPEEGKNPGPVLAKLLLDIQALTQEVNEKEGFVLMTLIGLKVEKLAKPMRWSEDFGWYLMKPRGAFFGVGDVDRL